MTFFSGFEWRYFLHCQKRQKFSYFRKRHIFADIHNRIKKFESEKKDFFTRRDTWLQKHQEFAHPTPKNLDIPAYAHENAVVISPHPDDEIIGCGGTLIRMQEAGSKISVVQLTDGSASSALEDAPETIRKTIRLEEATAVAKNLGFANLFLFREEDSNLICSRENVTRLSSILNRLRPAVIFVPFMNDPHPDHVAANEILGKSLESSELDLPKVAILSYEVWSLVPPDTICPVDRQFDKKEKMLMKYRTAMRVIDCVDFCESLNLYHAYKLLGKLGFAEVFLKIDAERYIELVREIKPAG
jgi:LmbE family N-acetylglucosaminyl deacetylase